MEKKPTYPDRNKSVKFNGDHLDTLTLPGLDSMLKLVDDLIFAEQKLKDEEMLSNSPEKLIDAIEKKIDFYIETKEVINFARYKKFQEVFLVPPFNVSKISL